MNKPTGAVVIGGYINGLGMVRSLAALGLPVAVIATETYDIAQHSRFAGESERVLGTAENPLALVELLERRTPDWRGRALFPTTDAALAAVTEHAGRLTGYQVVAPPLTAARVVLDKGLMRQAALAAGIAAPRCYGAAEAGNPALDEIVYPVVLKPLAGYRFSARFGVKMLAAKNRGELDANLRLIALAGLPCELFDLIPGRDDQIYAHCLYVDRAGRPSEGVTIRKLRQSPPVFGVARAAQVCPDPGGLRDQTLALLDHIGFRGMAAAEFKRDPRDGVFRFMEVNGRSVIYNGLLRRAGLDMAAMAIADLAGDPVQARPNGWNGVWINLLADVGYSLVNRRADPIGLGEILAPYSRPIEEAALSVRDPKPFFAQWAGAISGGASPGTTPP